MIVKCIKKKNSGGPFSTRPYDFSDPLKPSSTAIQQDALANAIAEIVWKAGSGNSATLCLPQHNQVHVTTTARFNEDGLTEKLVILNVSRFDELFFLIRRNIHVVTSLSNF